MTDSRIWIIWKDMLDRCRNPNFPWFHNYGGRGIKVCERWLTFENFAEDMGIGKKGWTLDRINNNGNYAPDNCCWATAKHQGRNKRNNRLVTVDGLTACLAEMAERFHINPETVSRRIRSGWPLDEAFKTPSQRANH